MSELEGGAPHAPIRPSLAYLEGEVGGGFAEREGAHLRQDSADGDVIETTFSTDLVTLQQQLVEKARTTERAIRASLELRNELTAVRAEAAAPQESVRSVRKAEPAPPAEEEQATSSRLVGDAFAELAKVRTEAFKARKELERERNEHRAEMIQARAQYNAAQGELQRLIKVRRTNGKSPPVAPPEVTGTMLPVPAPRGPRPNGTGGSWQLLSLSSLWRPSGLWHGGGFPSPKRGAERPAV